MANALFTTVQQLVSRGLDRLSDELSKRLQRIEEKIDSIIKLLEKQSPEVDVSVLPLKVNSLNSSQVNVYLLKLPDTLRLSMVAMIKLKEATTSGVAQETNRSRSVESIHLNQLERMGYLEKYRKSRKIFFRIPSPPK